MKWRYFIWACLLIGYGMLKAGAPPLAVATGLILATLWMWSQRRQGTEALKPNRESKADVRTADL